MPGQLSPAWRRKAAAHDCPDDARPDPAPAADGPRLIPLLLADSDQYWFVRDLCTLLGQRGHPAELAGMDEAAGTTVASEGLAFRLLPLLSTQLVRHQRLDHVVLLVPSSLDGVRDAYLRIKQLAAGDTTPEIGVVIIGPRDQHAAWRYFRKLAVGTLRYLDVPLLNLGFLPGEMTPQAGQADHHRTNFLARIGERLLRSEFYSRPSTETAP